jgi:hypothetical protein
VGGNQERKDGWEYVPKLDLKPIVARPSAGFSVGEYAPYALKDGCKVAAQPSQNAPKEPKTTKGNVLPIMNYFVLV